MVRSVGLDIGNDSVKLVMEGGVLAIPNIVAPGSARNLLREEDNVLEALDVEVFSRSLTGAAYYGTVGVCEIGALTTDFPIMKKLQSDNRFSHGEYFGLASYLDAIRQDVFENFGYNFQSRAKLVKRIRDSSYLINLVGERREGH
ncbi:acetate and sugar kinases/Hsc70/actin family protein [Effusibacillus dendaii]|uniref:Actin-like protein N-terminal domain-containing protein n=1 Tax=Effusibacillus dendaii TaxID=2743772 RepID=A0A7I8DF71_9BACL|nr:hypothetical protein [Effusibacillus dendaii]BCJ86561.1 hypothetical protein skT53_15460 [Effusibacillus dendaii]